jgi:hypothetical protein
MKRGLNLIVLLLLAIVLNLSLTFAGTLKVTSEHPFLVNGNWIAAKELSVGDEIMTASGEMRTIKRITWHPETVNVFNLEDEFYHNYIVSGDDLIVHNSNAVDFSSKGLSFIEKIGLNFKESEGAVVVVGDRFVIERTLKTNERIIHILPGKENIRLGDFEALVEELSKPEYAGIRITGYSPNSRVSKGFKLLESGVRRKSPGNMLKFRTEAYTPPSNYAKTYQKGVDRGYYPQGDSWIKFTIEGQNYNPLCYSLDSRGWINNKIIFGIVVPAAGSTLALTGIYVYENMKDLLEEPKRTPTPTTQPSQD